MGNTSIVITEICNELISTCQDSPFVDTLIDKDSTRMVRICCHRVNSKTDSREFLVEWSPCSVKETTLSWEPLYDVPNHLVQRYEATLRKLFPIVDTHVLKLADVDPFAVIPLAKAGEIDLQRMAEREPGLHTCI